MRKGSAQKVISFWSDLEKNHGEESPRSTSSSIGSPLSPHVRSLRSNAFVISDRSPKPSFSPNHSFFEKSPKQSFSSPDTNSINNSTPEMSSPANYPSPSISSNASSQNLRLAALKKSSLVRNSSNRLQGPRRLGSGIPRPKKVVTFEQNAPQVIKYESLTPDLSHFQEDQIPYERDEDEYNGEDHYDEDSGVFYNDVPVIEPPRYGIAVSSPQQSHRSAFIAAGHPMNSPDLNRNGNQSRRPLPQLPRHIQHHIASPLTSNTAWKVATPSPFASPRQSMDSPPHQHNRINILSNLSRTSQHDRIINEPVQSIPLQYTGLPTIAETSIIEETSYTQETTENEEEFVDNNNIEYETNDIEDDEYHNVLREVDSDIDGGNEYYGYNRVQSFSQDNEENSEDMRTSGHEVGDNDEDDVGVADNEASDGDALIQSREFTRYSQTSTEEENTETEEDEPLYQPPAQFHDETDHLSTHSSSTQRPQVSRSSIESTRSATYYAEHQSSSKQTSAIKSERTSERSSFESVPQRLASGPKHVHLHPSKSFIKKEQEDSEAENFLPTQYQSDILSHPAVSVKIESESPVHRLRTLSKSLSPENLSRPNSILGPEQILFPHPRLRNFENNPLIETPLLQHTPQFQASFEQTSHSPNFHRVETANYTNIKEEYPSDTSFSKTWIKEEPLDVPSIFNAKIKVEPVPTASVHNPHSDDDDDNSNDNNTSVTVKEENINSSISSLGVKQRLIKNQPALVKSFGNLGIRDRSVTPRSVSRETKRIASLSKYEREEALRIAAEESAALAQAEAEALLDAEPNSNRLTSKDLEDKLNKVGLQTKSYEPTTSRDVSPDPDQVLIQLAIPELPKKERSISPVKRRVMDRPLSTYTTMASSVASLNSDGKQRPFSFNAPSDNPSQISSDTNASNLSLVKPDSHTNLTKIQSQLQNIIPSEIKKEHVDSSPYDDAYIKQESLSNANMYSHPAQSLYETLSTASETDSGILPRIKLEPGSNVLISRIANQQFKSSPSMLNIFPNGNSSSAGLSDRSLKATEYQTYPSFENGTGRGQLEDFQTEDQSDAFDNSQWENESYSNFDNSQNNTELYGGKKSDETYETHDIRYNESDNNSEEVESEVESERLREHEYQFSVPKTPLQQLDRNNYSQSTIEHEPVANPVYQPETPLSQLQRYNTATESPEPETPMQNELYAPETPMDQMVSGYFDSDHLSDDQISHNSGQNPSVTNENEETMEPVESDSEDEDEDRLIYVEKEEFGPILDPEVIVSRVASAEPETPVIAQESYNPETPHNQIGTIHDTQEYETEPETPFDQITRRDSGNPYGNETPYNPNDLSEDEDPSNIYDEDAYGERLKYPSNSNDLISKSINSNEVQSVAPYPEEKSITFEHKQRESDITSPSKSDNKSFGTPHSHFEVRESRSNSEISRLSDMNESFYTSSPLAERRAQVTGQLLNFSAPQLSFNFDEIVSESESIFGDLDKEFDRVLKPDKVCHNCLITVFFYYFTNIFNIAFLQS